MRMKNYFHIKGWALNLVLIQRTGWTRKWPIPLEMRYVDGKHSGSQQIGSFQTTCTLPITSAESEPSFSLMKWIKTCSGSTTPEERFSDRAVHRHVLLWVIRGRRDMPASLYTGSSKKALSCQSVWLNRRVKKKRQKNYRCWTVLLVLTNSVSNLTNLYLWNQNIETLRIQTLPSNSPLPHSFGPGMFVSNSHTCNPLFEKILDRLDPPLQTLCFGIESAHIRVNFFPLKLKKLTLWQHLLIIN